MVKGKEENEIIRQVEKYCCKVCRPSMRHGSHLRYTGRRIKHSWNPRGVDDEYKPRSLEPVADRCHHVKNIDGLGQIPAEVGIEVGDIVMDLFDEKAWQKGYGP